MLRRAGSRVRDRSVLGAGVALVVLAACCAAAAAPGADVIRDHRADGAGLRHKPEIDIVRVAAANGPGGRAEFKIRMAGRLEPGHKTTRPFLLINTRGGRASTFEYLVLGPRVFRAVGKHYVKVGANRFAAHKRTWIYAFKPAVAGLEPGDRFGWSVLTARGKTADLAPDDHYRGFRIRASAGS